MAKKFVCEHKEGPSERLLPNRVMYTGTCKKYLYNILRNNNQFRHYFTQPIYLTNCPFTAMGFARRRSLFYRDLSAVLAIDTEKLEGGINYDFANFEKQRIIKDIRASKTVEEAMRKLNMNRTTFYYKVNKYNIIPKNLVGLDR